MREKPLVINLYGGPSSGKSTMGASLFSEFKNLGYNVELATEVAKDLTWEESFNSRSNQIYVFGKQQHRLWRLRNKVDFIICDGALLNCILYSKIHNCYSENFYNLVVEEYNKYENVDIFLNRVKPYNPNGRTQSEDEAKETDNKTIELLQDVRGDIGYDLRVNGERDSIAGLVESIKEYYHNGVFELK